MKPIVLFTLWFLGLTLTAQPQVSPETAKEILGNRFLMQEQAMSAWLKIDSGINCPPLSIPYTEATIRWCATENQKGRANFYLLPIMALEDTILKKFWKNYEPPSYLPPRITASYRLVNLKMPNPLSGASDREIEWGFVDLFGYTDKRIDAMDLMSPPDYFEVVATLSMATGNNFFSNWSWLIITRDKPPQSISNFNGELILAYASNIEDSCRETLVTYFPERDFTPGTITKECLTFLALENDEVYGLNMAPLKNISCIQQEKSYEVGAILMVKPDFPNF